MTLAKMTPLDSHSSDASPASLIAEVRKRLSIHLMGKDDLIELSLSAFLGGGHLLLEGPPGTGKTSLAKSMATAFGGSFHRIQMTSDLLPSDVVGILRLKPGEADFEFRRGPVFCHFLLADELNRTSPKTQSALLEAMAEGTVTVDGQSYPLPYPFFVCATQNPLEFHGVYPFAESQLDRFMMQLCFTSPDKKDELRIYATVAPGSQEPLPEELPILSIEKSLELRDRVQKVFVDPGVLEYMADLVRATRSHPAISYGASVRGGLQFLSAAKALAFVREREFVTPKDIRDLAVPVLAHRLCFTGGEPDARTRRETVQELIEKIQPPK